MLETEIPVRARGRVRSVGFAIVMSIVTLGVYVIYWTVQSFREISAFRGGADAGTRALGISALAVVGLVIIALIAGSPGLWEPTLLGVLLIVVICSFLLPSDVGRMYSEEGRTSPITGCSGPWLFVPYVRTFIWLAKIQSALNRFWSEA